MELTLVVIPQPLPAAEATGNMTLMPNSIVHEIIYDEENKKAKGVRVIDAENNQSYEYYAKVIFSVFFYSSNDINFDAIKIK